MDTLEIIKGIEDTQNLSYQFEFELYFWIQFLFFELKLKTKYQVWVLNQNYIENFLSLSELIETGPKCDFEFYKDFDKYIYLM